jgi:hypothetical protein
MSRKTKECYQHLLRYIDENLVQLKLASFITDYEASMRKAVQSLFPAAKIRGCWFHFCQALRRKVAKLPKLAKQIRHDQKVKRLYHKFLCIPLVPATKIISAYNELKTEAKSFTRFKPFLKYFEKQWLLKVS